MVVQVVGEAKHHSTCKSSDNHENICCHICHPNIRSKQFLVFICRVHFLCVYECMAQHVCMYLCFPTNELPSWEQKNVRNFHTDANIFKSSSPFSAMFFVQNIAMQPSIGEYRIYVCTYIEYLYLQWNETNRIFYIFNYVKTLIDWLIPMYHHFSTRKEHNVNKQKLLAQRRTPTNLKTHTRKSIEYITTACGKLLSRSIYLIFCDKASPRWHIESHWQIRLVKVLRSAFFCYVASVFTLLSASNNVTIVLHGLQCVCVHWAKGGGRGPRNALTKSQYLSIILECSSSIPLSPLFSLAILAYLWLAAI